MADDALKIVLRRRLAKLLFRISNRSPRPIGDAESIEDVTGFVDDVVNVEVRRRVNLDDDIGLGDVLARSLEPNTLSASTTMPKAVGVIADHASVSTHAEYKTRLRGRVRTAVVELLAARAAQAPGDRPPFDRVLQVRFERFLLSPVNAIDDSRPADEITDTLVRLMVVQ